MYRLSCYITLSGVTFDHVTDVVITETWRQLANTATITIPRNFKFRGEDLARIVNIGDVVSIALGYDNSNIVEFSGFVVGVQPTTPALIHCEDSMYLLKNRFINKTYSSTTAKDLITDLYEESDLPKPNITAPDVNVGAVTVNNASAASVLQQLRSDYWLHTFLRGDRVVCGVPYEASPKHKFVMGRNTAENNLQYIRKEQIRRKYKAVSIQKDGSKIEYTTGDSGAPEQTITTYGLSEADLKVFAEAKAAAFRYDGLGGSFTAFGIPSVKEGDICVLEDSQLPEYNGEYYADQVVKRFGTGGYRQEITLGPKVSAA